MPKRRIITILLLSLICARAYGQTAVSESAVKAAYIFHFFDFIDWNDQLHNYYVCVPDDPKLEEELENSLSGRVVNDRSIVITRNAQFCHVLITDRPPATRNSLTIGPLGKGALLEFRIVDNKLKFAVNFEKVKDTNLKISSQLLKLAIGDKAP